MELAKALITKLGWLSNELLLSRGGTAANAWEIEIG